MEPYEITYKANFLILEKSKKWLCDELGITQHTLNRRLVEQDWKKTEMFFIDHMHTHIKAEKGGLSVI